MEALPRLSGWHPWFGSLRPGVGKRHDRFEQAPGTGLFSLPSSTHPHDSPQDGRRLLVVWVYPPRILANPPGMDFRHMLWQPKRPQRGQEQAELPTKNAGLLRVASVQFSFFAPICGFAPRRSAGPGIGWRERPSSPLTCGFGLGRSRRPGPTQSTIFTGTRQAGDPSRYGGAKDDHMAMRPSRSAFHHGALFAPLLTVALGFGLVEVDSKQEWQRNLGVANDERPAQRTGNEDGYPAEIFSSHQYCRAAFVCANQPDRM